MDHAGWKPHSASGRRASGSGGSHRVEYAERYARELPETNLLQVPGRHIPQEDSPAPVAAALAEFFASRGR